MKQRLRQNSAVIVIMAVLIAITSVAAFLQLQQESVYPPLASASSQPDGARALRLWLEALDFAVTDESTAAFEPPAGAELTFILEPALPGLSEEEWQSLQAWIESGGVLVLAGEGFGAALSMQQVGFDIAYREGASGGVTVAGEANFSLAPEALSNLRPRAVLSSEESQHRPLLELDGELLAASLQMGDGLVVVSTLIYPFTNQGLKEAGNGDFILGLLRYTGYPHSIWFDEWHHGFRGVASSVEGLESWIRDSRPGQAILYLIAVLFLWLLINGQRFGSVVPLKRRQQRRATAEHAQALASLSRQAGHRQVVGAHFRRELKNALGKRYGLTAATPDPEFVQQIRAVHPDLDEKELGRLLHSLKNERLGNEEMLKLAQEASEWIQR